MTRDEWRVAARQHLDSRPKYETATSARLQAILEITRGLQKDADDETLLKTSALWPEWKPDVSYAAGDLINQADQLYRVAQTHTSQSDWAPDMVPTLFVRVANSAEEWPEYIPWAGVPQYKVDDKVTYNGNRYICRQANAGDYNTFAPSVWGWEKVD